MQKLTADTPETQSADLIAANVERLKELFPEAFTEGKIDFPILKQLLGDAVDEREEKYCLNWRGKRRARQLALTPSTGTLRPCPEESVDWDVTQNLVIEGDNLEVLKILQKSYAGKIKMIYIDPPYNTGKDFIYPDDFRDNIKNYLELTNQIDGGRKMTANTETSGRFHTDWLNMMYPRLTLARTLLREDGVIFISIDDNENANMRFLCNEIFGEENFIAQLVWNTDGHTDNQFDVKINHEYILLYSRNSEEASLGHVIDPNTREESNLRKGFAENSITKNGPGNPPSEIILPPNFPCSTSTLNLSKTDIPPKFYKEIEREGHITRDITDQFSVSYPIRRGDMVVRKNKLVKSCAVFSGWANANKLRKFITGGCVPIDESDGDKLSFYLSEKGVIYYRRDRDKARNILSVLRKMGTTERMRSELEDMGIPFQYPKPKELLRYLIQIGLEKDGIVMDFFSGSGTIAHALLDLNGEDNGNRQFILTQLPEPTGRTDYPAISDITKERIRRVITNFNDGDRAKIDKGEQKQDRGFRVFKLDSSNICTWEPKHDDIQTALLDATEHLKADRNERDILFELLLKLGLELTVPIETRSIAGKNAHSIGSGVLIACLAEKITREDIEQLAHGIVTWHGELAPIGDATIVFRDDAFADDVAKTNLAAILQQNGLKTVRSL